MLLTLDISTVQTGYCIGAPGHRPRWGVFRPGNLPRDERIAYIVGSVVQLAKATGADQVVAEQVSVGSFTKKDGTKGAGNFTSALALAEAHGAIRYALRPLKMATLNLSTARKALGIRQSLGIVGNPKKEDARRWLTAQGFPTVNGDEADALVLWMAVTTDGTGTIMQPQLRPRLTPSRKPSPGEAWLKG